MTLPSVAELIEATTERMRAPELLSEDPRQEARELVAHALAVLPAQLPEMASERLDARTHGDFLRLLHRRLALEPTGYIVGAVEILGLRFKVDRSGFIPRLDLPVLISAGLSRVPENAHGVALDLACGIGAAGICVAHARPGLQVDRADVSEEAIELARENAGRLIPGRARCFGGDLFTPLPPERRGQYLLVTANPPWVPDGTPLPQEVIDHEPHVSFFGGPDGLDVVRVVSRTALRLAHPGGTVVIEHGEWQGAAVRGILASDGWRAAATHPDLTMRDRATTAIHP